MREHQSDDEERYVRHSGRQQTRRSYAGLFCFYCLGGASVLLVQALRAPAAPKVSLEEPGPPTKEELGRAGWTLLHTMAAVFPDQPSRSSVRAAEQFMRALGDLYPCPTCAGHLRTYMAAHPVAVSSREQLSLWMCGAHNDVNKRNGKEEFFCDMGVLDARWKDCGCGKNATATAAPGTKS